MKSLLFVFFIIFSCILQAQEDIPFSLYIHDTVIVMNKRQGVISMNISIIKNIKEENIILNNFFRFIKKDHMSFHVAIINAIVSVGHTGLNYYLENENGDMIEWIGGYADPIKIEYHKKNRTACVDTVKKRIIFSSSCNNEQIINLKKEVTYLTIYPMIKYDYLYNELKKEKECYLVLYYVFPKANVSGRLPPIAISNKIKLIIK